MDLILWRHAEAEPGEIGQADEERVLTPKGRKQARKMAEWLDAKVPDSCRILCSPAFRAVQTAEALGRKFKLVATLGPANGAACILSAARWPIARDAVLVIGHQPGLGRTAALLVSGVEQDWAVRKGGVWWIGQREHRAPTPADHRQPCATPKVEIYLRAVMTPELVGK
ncbi:MAG: phosphohistidine phosphatase SixA [Burkholderiaceae bacterium]